MSSLSQFSAFVAVARHLSFAAASRELDLAPSSVAKSVSRLERSMGVRLFHRTTRSVRLTSDGEALYERCVDVLARVDALEQLTLNRSAEPSGTLRISAPVGYGGMVVVPVVADMLRRYPAMEVDLRLTDDRVDLIRDGLDAAVRFGSLPDSDLIARQYDTQPLLLCASPAYLARRGTPASIDEVKDHDLVVFRFPATGRERPFEFIIKGELVPLRAASRLRISHGASLVDAMLAGSGLAQVPAFMVADHLRAGRLVELLGDFRPPPLAVSLVNAGARELSPRTAALLACLRAHVAGTPSVSTRAP